MKFFIDSCDVEQVAQLSALGLVDGVTTNPSIIAKAGLDFFDIISQICEIVDTSVSAEVIATEYDEMLKEAYKLVEIGEQITIKLPLTYDGIKACKTLSSQGYSVNVTLCFSTAQALIAAKAGAEYVSPFIGRLEDIGENGISLIEDICHVFNNYEGLKTKVLVASVRNIHHVLEAARIGADVVTCPPAVLKQMLDHHLTDKGLEKFLKDWKSLNQSIL